MSFVKRQLQDLYDDQSYIGNVLAEQMILGKRYTFVEVHDRQDQRQWQEELRNNNEFRSHS